MSPPDTDVSGPLETSCWAQVRPNTPRDAAESRIGGSGGVWDTRARNKGGFEQDLTARLQELFEGKKGQQRDDDEETGLMCY